MVARLIKGGRLSSMLSKAITIYSDDPTWSGLRFKFALKVNVNRMK